MHAAKNSNTCVTLCMQYKTTEGWLFRTAILGGGQRTVVYWRGLKKRYKTY